MGTSHYAQIPLVLKIVEELRPRAALEIGAGSGKWGVLLREYLGPGTRLEAIEAWEPNVGPLHAAVYDQVRIGDARLVVPTLTEHFDLVLMIDVFEHLTPADGAVLLRGCRRIAPQILISVPATWDAQGGIAGNEHEMHRAHYTAAQLRRLGFDQVWRFADHLVALEGAAPLHIQGTLRKWGFGLLAPRATTALVATRDRIRRAPQPPREFRPGKA